MCNTVYTYIYIEFIYILLNYMFVRILYYTGLDIWLYLENSGVSDWKGIRRRILMYGIGTSKVLRRGLNSLGYVTLLVTELFLWYIKDIYIYMYVWYPYKTSINTILKWKLFPHNIRSYDVDPGYIFISVGKHDSNNCGSIVENAGP